jgi:hypothetical protein
MYGIMFSKPRRGFKKAKKFIETWLRKEKK